MVNRTNGATEIAKFEDNFLKINDNAWADDAIEATNVHAIADDIPIKNSTGDEISGQVEMIEDADGNIWYRLLKKFDTNQLKKLTGIIPTGNRLTNLKFDTFRKMLPDGYIKKLGQNYANDLNKIKNGLDKSGRLTENIVAEAFRKEGYTVIDDLGKYGSNNGFDVVAFKGSLDNPSEIIIIEAKQFKQNKILAEFDDIATNPNYDLPSGLVLNPNNPNTGLPTQMSDNWVFNKVRDEIFKRGGNQTKLAMRLRDSKEIVEKYVFAIDKSTGNGYFTKLSSF